MTKARDAIEPLIMTQTVTKAREMGKVNTSHLCSHKCFQPQNACLTKVGLFFFSDLSRTYTQDGVCLTESGLCQLQSLSATASRRRKPKPKLKLKIINQNSVAVLQTPVDHLSEHSRDEEMEDNRGTSLFAHCSLLGFSE